jgi:hypothetical protein
MTTEEMTKIAIHSAGTLTDFQCRCLVHYMIGYMRYATNIEAARKEYFTQVQAAIEGKSLPVI